MNTTIKAEIVAHSKNEYGDELISVLATFPRIILAEVNTHRMLSKNTSSSRAIPFKKMVESVENDPFIPIAWQKAHSGMQGSEYFLGTCSEELSHLDRAFMYDEYKDVPAVKHLESEWLMARDNAVQQATALFELGVTKQLCNRLLEPFMWTTMLITGSREGWDNFFNLRCPEYILEDVPTINHDFSLADKNITLVGKSKKQLLKTINDINNESYDACKNRVNNFTDLDWMNINKGQAEIHIMDLAEKIWDAVNESTPKQLYGGEWHIPFEDKIQWSVQDGEYTTYLPETLVKISTAMAARTSYTVVGDEKGINAEKMIELHDRLLSQDPPHSSPLEHCARAMTDEEYMSFWRSSMGKFKDLNELKKVEGGICNNFKGFVPYRYMIDNNYN